MRDEAVATYSPLWPRPSRRFRGRFRAQLDELDIARVGHERFLLCPRLVVEPLRSRPLRAIAAHATAFGLVRQWPAANGATVRIGVRHLLLLPNELRELGEPLQVHPLVSEVVRRVAPAFVGDLERLAQRSFERLDAIE